MTTGVRPFVQHYDRIYGDKDYARDITVFSKLAGLPSISAPSVLEIGPGTGNHTALLSRLCASLVSVEIDPDFVEILRSKVERLNLRNVEVEAVTLVRLGNRKFDAACALFHVLNYIAPSDMPVFVHSLAALMKPGAWFVADLWNWEAVTLDPPRHDVRKKALANGALTQIINPSFDRSAATVRLDYHISIEPTDPPIDFRETLDLQMWARPDLQAIFDKAGFDEISFHAYADVDQAPDARSFRQWLRARKN